MLGYRGIESGGSDECCPRYLVRDRDPTLLFVLTPELKTRYHLFCLNNKQVFLVAVGTLNRVGHIH